MLLFRLILSILHGSMSILVFLVLLLFLGGVERSHQAQTGFFVDASGNYDVVNGGASTIGGNSLPVLVFSGKTSGVLDVPANPDFINAIPSSFQYRIVDASKAIDKDHKPWVTDEYVRSVVSPKTNCVELLKATSIVVKTGNPQISKDVPLKPIPATQDWVYSNTREKFRLVAEPGIMREYLSSCCDPASCPEKCLEFTSSQTWYLEINAPQMGYDGSRGSAGGSMRDLSYGDPGVWPVFRTQCTYCPVVSCITSCVEGEVIATML